MDGSQAEARTLAGENGSFLIPADARGRVTSWRRLLLIPPYDYRLLLTPLIH